MLAYHNDINIKAGVLAKMAKHREADKLVQYETRFGISRLLARLEDGIFEGLPVAEAKLWAERFLSAIPVGANLYMVFYKFMHWLLVDIEDGVLKYAKTDRTRNAIKNLGDLYSRHISGEKISKTEWYAAYADARIKQADKLIELLKECN